MSSSLNEDTTYFGYGSNLWRHQMVQRCPTSEYLGIARLNQYRWIIDDRGYANIVQIPAPSIHPDAYDYTHEVWGLVYRLQPEDEARLDVNEGVPVAYTKEDLTCDFWPGTDASPSDVHAAPQPRSMLVYINRDRITEAPPKEEYIYRMNMGVRDALVAGMPREYVGQVIRRFIPDVDDATVVERARKQALAFEDER